MNEANQAPKSSARNIDISAAWLNVAILTPRDEVCVIPATVYASDADKHHHARYDRGMDDNARQRASSILQIAGGLVCICGLLVCGGAAFLPIRGDVTLARIIGAGLLGIAVGGFVFCVGFAKRRGW